MKHNNANVAVLFILIFILAGLGIVAINKLVKSANPVVSGVTGPISVASSVTPIPNIVVSSSDTFVSNTDYSDVLVVINKNSSTSEEIGKYFTEKRNIPAANLVYVNATTSEEISAAEFQNLRSQIESYILANDFKNRIDYIVTTKGIPLKVKRNGSDYNQASASVDSELTLILSSSSPSIGAAGRLMSPYYFRDYQDLAHFSRGEYGIYLVTRLDGYTVSDVERLIDKGNAAVPFTSSTKFVFDEDPAWNNDPLNYGMADTANSLIGRGLNVLLDTTTDYLVNQQDVVGYVSWGSNDHNVASSTIHADPRNTWHAGGIAVTFVSTSARTFNWPPAYGQSLIADLIAEGATGAEGYAYEPYASSMPNLMTLFTAYTSGYNLAESFYASSPYLSWMGVVIGDPKETIVVNESKKYNSNNE